MSIRTRFNPLGTIGRKKALPAGYIALEYLESTGTQYIDTGIVPDDLTGLWELSSKRVSEDYVSSGARNNQTRFYGYCSSIPREVCYGRGSYVHTGYYITNSDDYVDYKHNYRNSRTIVANEHVLASNIVTISGITSNILMFGYSSGTTTNVIKRRSRIKYLKLTQGQKLVRNFIPALDPTGRPCMFDTVTQQPYYNKGTGEFKFNYQLIDEYLNVDVSGTRVAIPTDITLADSLGFVLTAECIYRGDIDNWTNIMYLGGKSAEGWFGLQHNGTNPSDHGFIYSNNYNPGSLSVTIPVNIPLVCTLDKNGLSVNGTQYGPVATQAYNKTAQVVGSWDKRISVKSWVLTSNNAKIIDVHAVMIRDKKYLYDFANSVIIKVTTP